MNKLLQFYELFKINKKKLKFWLDFFGLEIDFVIVKIGFLFLIFSKIILSIFSYFYIY